MSDTIRFAEGTDIIEPHQFQPVAQWTIRDDRHTVRLSRERAEALAKDIDAEWGLVFKMANPAEAAAAVDDSIQRTWQTLDGPRNLDFSILAGKRFVDRVLAKPTDAVIAR